ncbi:MAG: hypothetical protein WKF82_13225 [Nocardioidaceae bacterium]
MPPPAGFGRRRLSHDRQRYAAWQGGPDPLAAPFDVRGALDEIGHDVLEGRSVRDALRELLQRGAAGRRGLDDLRRDVRRRRRQLERRGNLAGTLDQVRQALDQVLAAEREALAAEDGDAARLDEITLDELPPDTAGAVRVLRDYRWHSSEAARGFQDIQRLLRAEVLDAQFQGMKQAAADGDPAVMQRVRNMLTDLNLLLAAHARGDDTAAGFDDFMQQHGEFFPEQPRDVNDLIDLLARRQQAADRLMRSLTSQQRAELQDLLAEAFDDVDLESQLTQLSDNLRALRPGSGRQPPLPIDGSESLGYGDAVGAVADLADLEALERQLAQEHPGATLDDVDAEAVERQLAPRRPRTYALCAISSPSWRGRDTCGVTVTGSASRRRRCDDSVRPPCVGFSTAWRPAVMGRTTTAARDQPMSEREHSSRGASETRTRSTPYARSTTPCYAGPLQRRVGARPALRWRWTTSSWRRQSAVRPLRWRSVSTCPFRWFRRIDGVR